MTNPGVFRQRRYNRYLSPDPISSTEWKGGAGRGDLIVGYVVKVHGRWYNIALYVNQAFSALFVARYGVEVVF